MFGVRIKNFDEVGKSLLGRHSREGGSPEYLGKTGFPPTRERQERAYFGFLQTHQFYILEINHMRKERCHERLSGDQS
jgi:hypothetical protein